MAGILSSVIVRSSVYPFDTFIRAHKTDALKLGPRWIMWLAVLHVYIMKKRNWSFLIQNQDVVVLAVVVLDVAVLEVQWSHNKLSLVSWVRDLKQVRNL